MSTSVTSPTRSSTDAIWLPLINVSTAIGTLGLIIFFITGTFFATISGGDFTHTADYWYTGAGLPIAAAGIGITLGVHRLQEGADGRLGHAGVWINAVALTELFVQLGASVATGSELRWGPMYVLCTALTFVGTAVLAAGSWRTGLLPKWMLGLWPLVWVLGSFAGFGPMPLVLAAFLIALAGLVGRHHQTTA